MTFSSTSRIVRVASKRYSLTTYFYLKLIPKSEALEKATKNRRFKGECLLVDEGCQVKSDLPPTQMIELKRGVQLQRLVFLV